MARLYAFIFTVIIFAVGLSAGFYLTTSKTPAEIGNFTVPSNFSPIVPVDQPFGTSISAPAIDNSGNGVSTQIFVEARGGTGQALVDVNQLLFWIDTQYSIRTAKSVAENYTGVDLREWDLKYGIRTDAEIIEGPSAGAAIAIATIAAIENRSLPSDVMITGTIEPDGTIGRVGGIVEKAKAAKQAGASLLLVPEGQSQLSRHVPNTTCQHIGSFRYCSTKFVNQDISVEREAGLQVKEVKTIWDAAPSFGL